MKDFVPIWFDNNQFKTRLTHGVIFFYFQARMLGGQKIGQKNRILIILDTRLTWNSN
jgi:hypothetical protein